jgi:hypothetical protein
MTARSRRWLTLALAPLVATAMLVAPAAPASAAPAPAAPAEEGSDDTDLGAVLEKTGRTYATLKAKSKKLNDQKLAATLAVSAAEAKRDALLPQAGQVAAESYRTGSLSSVGFLLNSRSSKLFLKRAIALNELNTLNDKKLQELNKAVADVDREQARLNQLLATQKKQEQAMLNQKQSAERALSLIGGESLTGGFVDAKSPEAKPAPRNSSGDFSPESCKAGLDPTTSGCITPRTLHMYKEVRKAGFDRFVGCFRTGGPFEHPKGRACDWSLQERGFASAHNADMRRYGNDLMAFLVRNADRLGILYVIWFKKIWFPATGWKGYRGPSAHTDHVHVSML